MKPLAKLSLFLWVCCSLSCTVSLLAQQPFELQVLDAETKRGIPLVEIETVNHIPYITDSHGSVAFDEPGMLGQAVYFQMRSHGYESPRDGFGSPGVTVRAMPGGRAEVKLKRLQIAERLYRITGQGIYADSVRLQRPVPLQQPVINGLVLGQDSTMAIPYRGKLRWFWGDTLKMGHPLGHFKTAGATSMLPRHGGLDPVLGIDLTYFVDQEGFSRPMAPLTEQGLVWIDGLLTVVDSAQNEVMLAHFSRRQSLATELEHGLLRYDDAQDIFVQVASLEPENNWRHPRGQATLHDGYWYFSHPFATTRVRATLDDVLNRQAYEALAEATDAQGKPVYCWQSDTPPISQKTEALRLAQAGATALVPHLQLRAAETDQPVLAHAGSVRWNAHRRCWIMIFVQQMGTSYLGEVWYAEAPQIYGPWSRAVKIVTHEKYSFYNPVQHAFFDQDDGRYIFFEGTYTHTFSGNTLATPRYEYNQIMYRLDIDDPRLR